MSMATANTQSTDDVREYYHRVLSFYEAEMKDRGDGSPRRMIRSSLIDDEDRERTFAAVAELILRPLRALFRGCPEFAGAKRALPPE